MKKQYDFSGGRRGPVLKAQSAKTRITIRLDDDVLDWFREQAHAVDGGSYQTMINDVLRSLMESHQRESLEQTLRRVLREELPKLRKASG